MKMHGETIKNIKICLELVTPDILGACTMYGRCCLIPDFRREVDENCALLGYDTASSGNSLPTFQDNLSVLSATLKIPYRRFGTTCRSRQPKMRLYYLFPQHVTVFLIFTALHCCQIFF